MNDSRNGRNRTAKRTHGGHHDGQTLVDAVDLAGWPTPMAGSPATEQYNEAGNTDSSRKTVAICGWPTPNVPNGGRQSKDASGYRADGSKQQLSPETVAALAGWATPRAEDAESCGMRHGRGTADTLSAQAGQDVAGWATPAARDHKSRKASQDTMDKNARPLSDQVETGLDAGTSAATEKPAAYRLNPLFSLWLMGYPAAWASCGARAMQSCRRRPRRS